MNRLVNRVQKDLNFSTNQNNLLLVQENKDRYSHFLKWSRTYEGMPVRFSEVRAHLDPNTNQLLFTQNLQNEEITADTIADLSLSEAIRLAQGEILSWGTQKQVVPVQFEKILYDPETLAWEIRLISENLNSYLVYVDAHRGNVLEVNPENLHAHQQEIWDSQYFEADKLLSVFQDKCLPKPVPKPTVPKPVPVCQLDPVTGKPDPATCQTDPSACDPDPLTGKPNPTTCKFDPRDCDPDPATGKPDPATCTIDPKDCYPDPRTGQPNPMTCASSCTILDSLQFMMNLRMGVKKNNLLTPEAQPDPTATNPEALNVYRNTARVYDYYYKNFNRDSFDNKGGVISSAINVGSKWNNAAWMPALNMMIYGNGDGIVMHNLTSGIDVIGHELTHAMVSHTANLINSGEAGALNESFADFFGKMIENKGSWRVGETVFVNPQRAIRNMQDPAEFRDPEFYADRWASKSKICYEKRVCDPADPTSCHSQEVCMENSRLCTEKNDFCWVHKDAGIPNRAAYLFTSKVGRSFAQAVYYVALTTLMHPRSDFRDTAEQLLKACSLVAKANQLDPAGPCQHLITAWIQVGIPLQVPTDWNLWKP